MIVARKAFPVLLDRKLFPTLTGLYIHCAQANDLVRILGLARKSNIRTLMLNACHTSDCVLSQLGAVLASGRLRKLGLLFDPLSPLLAAAPCVAQAHGLERFGFFVFGVNSGDSTAYFQPFIAAVTRGASGITPTRVIF